MRLRAWLIFILGMLAMLAPLLSCANTPITQIEFGSSVWSADSQRIVFEVSLEEKSEIYSMSLQDTYAHQLTNNDFNESSPAWSPDGSQIAFISDRNGNHDIYVTDTDGENIRPVTNNGNRLIEYQPSWSPDGMYIAFWTKDALYTIQTEGRNLKRFPSVGGRIWYKRSEWSPDSTQIVVSESHKGLFIINTGNGDTRKIIDYDVDYAYPGWLSDNRIVFMANLDYPQEWWLKHIYAIDIDGENIQRLTAKVGVQRLTVSPDKRRLAFSQDVDITAQHPTDEPIYVMDADEGNMRQLTENYNTFAN